jgi:tRNA G10  N-methylase Trm11
MEGCGRKIGPYPCCSIITGDAKELAPAIPDESVDLVFTDPPYDELSLPLYEWLATESARALKPGRFCLAMCGGLHFNRIVAMMDKHLDFFWKYEVYLTGWATGCVWPRGNTDVHIVTRTKPLLAYSRGWGLPRVSTVGMVRGSGEDKRFHAWGQDEITARYYIDCFSARGELVVDPLCGGGTSLAMAHQIGRHYLAFEIDPGVAERARERVRNTQPPLFVMEPEQTEMELT